MISLAVIVPKGTHTIPHDTSPPLTAMTPAAAVSGIYLAHPQARYFSVGRIGRDQVEDYAVRKGMSLEETERWLRPNLGYETRALSPL